MTLLQWISRKAARHLSHIGHEKQRASKIERTRQMRRELGLPDHPALRGS